MRFQVGLPVLVAFLKPIGNKGSLQDIPEHISSIYRVLNPVQRSCGTSQSPDLT